jgi:hypothetical protein
MPKTESDNQTSTENSQDTDEDGDEAEWRRSNIIRYTVVWMI